MMQPDKNKFPTLEKLKRQKTILENRIQQAEAWQKSSDKKRDSRRKILLGV